MCNRRPEESQKTISHQPSDDAFISVDGLDHVFKSAVDNLAPVFRVHLFRGCGRTANVTKQHGNHAALADHFSAGPRFGEPGLQLPGDESLKCRFLLDRFCRIGNGRLCPGV